MFKTSFLMILLSSALTVMVSEEAMPADKLRVVVVKFSAQGEARLESYLADAVYESLLTALIDSGEYKVLEREKLKVIMDEMKLQNSDDFNDNLRAKLGKLYNAQLIVLGSLTRIGSRYTINVRGVDVETGEHVFAKSLDTTSRELLQDLVPKIVDLISGKKSKEDVEKELQEKRKQEAREMENRRKEEERIRKQDEEYYKRKQREEAEAKRKREWEEAEAKRKEDCRKFQENNRYRQPTSSEIKTGLSITASCFALISFISLFPAAANGYYFFNTTDLNRDIYNDPYPSDEVTHDRQVTAGYTALGFTISLGVSGIVSFILFSMTSGKFAMNSSGDQFRLAENSQLSTGMDIELDGQTVGVSFRMHF